MGKSTISMAIFNSYVKLPEGSVWTMIVLGKTGLDLPISGITKLWKSASDWGIKTTHPHQIRHRPLYPPVIHPWQCKIAPFFWIFPFTQFTHPYLWYFFTFTHLNITYLSGWWLSHPSEKYEPAGVTIPNIREKTCSKPPTRYAGLQLPCLISGWTVSSPPEIHWDQYFQDARTMEVGQTTGFVMAVRRCSATKMASAHGLVATGSAVLFNTMGAQLFLFSALESEIRSKEFSAGKLT